ncbi:MAG: ABC transporter permease [Hyphomicrobiales bacterium]|nr:ABC transporter permease [Hyphomicrobiales bacterium]
MTGPARASLFGVRLASVGFMLGGWVVLSWLLQTPKLDLFPSPWRAAMRGFELAHSELGRDTLASLEEAAGGWLIGSLLGIALGLIIGRFALARLLLRPVIDFLRFISPLAWVPLAILWFGIGYWSKASIIVLISLFTVVVNTVHGVSAIEREVVKASQSLHLHWWQRLEVVLMSAMPDILLGLRYSLGASWGGVVIAELVAGEVGIGALESYGGQAFDVAQIMVGMVVLAALGYLANFAFMQGQRRLFPWIVSNRRT